jgi:hypothetical protein
MDMFVFFANVIIYVAATNLKNEIKIAIKLYSAT